MRASLRKAPDSCPHPTTFKPILPLRPSRKASSLTRTSEASLEGRVPLRTRRIRPFEEATAAASPSGGDTLHPFCSAAALPPGPARRPATADSAQPCCRVARPHVASFFPLGAPIGERKREQGAWRRGARTHPGTPRPAARCRRRWRGSRHDDLAQLFEDVFQLLLVDDESRRDVRDDLEATPHKHLAEPEGGIDAPRRRRHVRVSFRSLGTCSATASSIPRRGKTSYLGRASSSTSASRPASRIASGSGRARGRA